MVEFSRSTTLQIRDMGGWIQDLQWGGPAQSINPGSMENCPQNYQNDNFDTSIEKINYYQFKGPHPSGLSSTHISKIYPVNLNRKVWTINYQDITYQHESITVGYPQFMYRIHRNSKYGNL